MQKQPRWTDHLRAAFSLLVLCLSCMIFFIPILFLGLLKLLPIPSLKIRTTKGIDLIATMWCEVNNRLIAFQKLSRISCSGLENLTPNDWNLVIANHQSWLDIVVLQNIMNRKMPVLKFFIKDQLKWIPLLGFAWWALGCPFMKRYSKSYLDKNPHKKGKDIQATVKAIKQFEKTPVSVMNFVEGTRFTNTKQSLQQSPYQHLLKPKAGGIGFVISVLHEKIDHLIDVTIIYPKKYYSLWDFLCKRINTIHVRIRKLPIPQEFKTSKLVRDSQSMDNFKTWLNEQWVQKDLIAQELKGQSA